MKPRAAAVAELESSGYTFKRHGANHDIFYNPATGSIIPLKRHDFDESDLRYIRAEIRKSERRK